MDFDYSIGDTPEDMDIDVDLEYNNNGDIVQNLEFEIIVVHSDTYEGKDTQTIDLHTFHFERQWLIGGDMAQIEGRVNYILERIHVFHYPEIVERLTQVILDLRNPNRISVERVIMNIRFITFDKYGSSEDDDNDDDNDDYDDDDDDDGSVDDMEVTLPVAPASNEAGQAKDMAKGAGQAKDMAYNKPRTWLVKAGQTKDMTYDKAGQAKDKDKAGQAMVYDKADQAKDMAYDKAGSLYDKASQAKDFAYDKAGDTKDVIKMATDKSDEDKYTNGTYETAKKGSKNVKDMASNKAQDTKDTTGPAMEYGKEKSKVSKSEKSKEAYESAKEKASEATGEYGTYMRFVHRVVPCFRS